MILYDIVLYAYVDMYCIHMTRGNKRFLCVREWVGMGVGLKGKRRRKVLTERAHSIVDVHISIW